MTVVSLANRLATPPAQKTKTVLDRWFEGLETDDRLAVSNAITDSAWRHVDLLGALIEEGMPEVADTTFGVWRRRMGYTK